MNNYTNNAPVNKKKNWKNRLLVFTPTTGLVRMEWVRARYGQCIPTNWSNFDLHSYLNGFFPIEYQLADAENMMVEEMIKGDYEWVISIEQDNIIPPDAFLRINEYIIDKKIPIVSGVYFTKTVPPEPILYRGRGTGHFADWKFGDKVWVDGIPFGFTLIHASILKAMWDESEEYVCHGQKIRKIFEQPNMVWQDPETGAQMVKKGTTDLEWCSRIMKDDIFIKAGWSKYQKMKNPFLVDTRLFIKHIDQNGVQYPLTIPKKFISPKGYKGRTIK